MLVPADVYRQAAIEQLKTLGRQIDVALRDTAHAHPAGHGAGADAIGFDLRQVGAETAAARVGDQRHGDVARQQLTGEGLGREHVAPGAAGGEHDLGGAFGADAHHAASPPTRRRVSASSMPMPSARAISEEPP